MTKKQQPCRVDVAPMGRGGFELQIVIDGKPVARSIENYTRRSSALRGARRLATRLGTEFFSSPID